MPLRGAGIKGYDWCCVCRSKIPKATRLTVHLREHGLVMIPGCPDCDYFRERTGDITKHALTAHGVCGLASREGDTGFRWGLTVKRDTYKDVSKADLIEYPLEGDVLSRRQRQFLLTAALGTGEEVDEGPSRESSHEGQRKRRPSRELSRGKREGKKEKSRPRTKKTPRLHLAETPQATSSADRDRQPTQEPRQSRSPNRREAKAAKAKKEERKGKKASSRLVDLKTWPGSHMSFRSLPKTPPPQFSSPAHRSLTRAPSLRQHNQPSLSLPRALT